MVMEEGGLKPQGSCSLLGVASVIKIQFETVCACRIHHLLCFCSAILAEYSTCLYVCTYRSGRVQAVPGKVGVDGEVLLRAKEHGVYF